MKELYSKLSELQDAISTLTGAFSSSEQETEENTPALPNLAQTDLTPEDLAVTDRTKAWRRLLVGKALMALSKLTSIFKKMQQALPNPSPEQGANELLAAPATPNQAPAQANTARRR